MEALDRGRIFLLKPVVNCTSQSILFLAGDCLALTLTYTGKTPFSSVAITSKGHSLDNRNEKAQKRFKQESHDLAMEVYQLLSLHLSGH